MKNYCVEYTFLLLNIYINYYPFDNGFLLKLVNIMFFVLVVFQAVKDFLFTLLAATLFNINMVRLLILKIEYHLLVLSIFAPFFLPQL